MKLSVEKYAETGEPIVLLLKHGAWSGRSVAIDLETCGDPTCACAKVDFHCRPLKGGQMPAEDDPEIVFALDAQERRVVDPETGDLSHEARSLGKAVLGELDEPDWQDLLEYVAMVKRDVLQTTDLAALDVAFPEEIMEGDDSLVGYTEIFPYAELSSFELGGCKWIVDDQYCVDPDYEAAEALLTFLVMPEGADAAEPATSEGMPAVLYNYGSGAVENVEVAPQAGQPAIADLLQAARAAMPDFDAELKSRHALVRTLFRKALLREEVAPVPQRREEPKIGRNDPCPCGSGEKYKKCCGVMGEGADDE